ncbi:MAG: hypothetical protein ABIT76_14810 [Chthoniobacterales bacterium]
MHSPTADVSTVNVIHEARYLREKLAAKLVLLRKCRDNLVETTAATCELAQLARRVTAARPEVVALRHAAALTVGN